MSQQLLFRAHYLLRGGVRQGCGVSMDVSGGVQNNNHHHHTTQRWSSSKSSSSSSSSNSNSGNSSSITTTATTTPPPPTTTTGGGSASASSPPSMLRRVWRSLTVDNNDDHSNEHKIQERKDLYYLLLITKLREVRLDKPDLEYMEAFEEAFAILEQRDLDSKSNVQLRYEMQDILGPQVLDVLEVFDHIDKDMDPQLFHTEDTDSSDVMQSHDYSVYKQVLQEDLEATAARCEKFKSSPDLASTDAISLKLTRSIAFLERKLGALQAILDFHGWSEGREGKGDWASNFPTDFDDEMDDFGFRITTADEETFISIRQYQTINMYRAAMLRKELGYSIIALKSLVPGAGRGVFVDGTALAGSLVAFQPGNVWPLGSVRPDVEEHFQDNHNLQLSIRYDNFIVDSRRSPYTVLTRPRSNPFALGHVVNHPQPGSLPNCQSVMLNFTQDMDLRDMQRYIPNTYSVPPAWINRTFDRYVIDMHSMCLLARRDTQVRRVISSYGIMCRLPVCKNTYSIRQSTHNSFSLLRFLHTLSVGGGNLLRLSSHGKRYAAVVQQGRLSGGRLKYHATVHNIIVKDIKRRHYRAVYSFEPSLYFRTLQFQTLSIFPRLTVG